MDSKWLKIVKQYDVHCLKIKKATTPSFGETDKEKQIRVKNLEKDYIAWFEYYFGHYAKVKCAPFHRKLANKIISNRKSKTIAEIFRSGAKSVHTGMGVPLFLYFTGELNFFLQIGENAPKAKKLIGKIQAELEYNQKLINDYGQRMGKGSWADGDFLTSDGIRFMSLGWEQSARGLSEGAERPDYISVDDVDSKRHVNNKDLMRAGVEKITEEIMGCFDAADDGTERFVYANNNFHKNSITNRLKAEFNKNIKLDKLEGKQSDYYVLTVTAVVDLINFEPTWAAKTTSEYWRNKYNKNKKAFLREYMHIHVDEGKIFKAEYFRYEKMLRLNQYDALIFVGDLSYKDKGDYKGFYLIGKKGKEYHIIHCFLRQTSRRIVAAWLYDKYEERNLGRYNIRYIIDGLFAQDEFVNDFDAEGEERGYYIAVIANKEKYGDKYNHIESIEGRFERRWVVFNIDEKENPDQMDTVEQFLAFEKGGGANDDGPDAIAVGFKELDKLTFIEKFEPMIIQRETYQNQSY